MSAARVFFAVGTGRCGTKFCYELFSLHGDGASHHERSPMVDTFERWSTWNRLPLDHQGFLASKQADVQRDLAKHAWSFEASAYLSLSVERLHAAMAPKFLFLVRDPLPTVKSLYSKGVYEQVSAKSEPTLCAGYQDVGSKPHHFFSRIEPYGEEYADWANLTRFGKVAWFWSTINREALGQLEQLPEDCWRMQQIETFDHAAYEALCDWLEIPVRVTPRRFEKLGAKRPNKIKRARETESLGELEMTEFEQQVAPLRARLGYEFTSA